MMAGGRVVGSGRRAVGGLVFVGVGSVGLGIVLVGCVGQSAGSGGSETGGGSTAVVPVPTSGGEASSAGTGSATGDVGSTSGESGSVFIIKPDNPGPLGCDVLKQDCAEGEKCTAWAEGGGGAWNATKCVEVMGDRQPGEACMTFGGAISGMDDCSKGAMCWDVSAENVGICVAFCMGTADAPSCEGNLSCYVGGDGVLIFCLPVCDPLIQDCPGDALCVMIDDEVACVEDASGAAGVVNDPCELYSPSPSGHLRRSSPPPPRSHPHPRSDSSTPTTRPPALGPGGRRGRRVRARRVGMILLSRPMSAGVAVSSVMCGSRIAPRGRSVPRGRRAGAGPGTRRGVWR